MSIESTYIDDCEIHGSQPHVSDGEMCRAGFCLLCCYEKALEVDKKANSTWIKEKSEIDIPFFERFIEEKVYKPGDEIDYKAYNKGAKNIQQQRIDVVDKQVGAAFKKKFVDVPHKLILKSSVSVRTSKGRLLKEGVDWKIEKRDESIGRIFIMDTYTGKEGDKLKISYIADECNYMRIDSGVMIKEYPHLLEAL